MPPCYQLLALQHAHCGSALGRRPCTLFVLTCAAHTLKPQLKHARAICTTEDFLSSLSLSAQQLEQQWERLCNIPYLFEYKARFFFPEFSASKSPPTLYANFAFRCGFTQSQISPYSVALQQRALWCGEATLRGQILAAVKPLLRQNLHITRSPRVESPFPPYFMVAIFHFGCVNNSLFQAIHAEFR